MRLSILATSAALAMLFAVGLTSDTANAAPRDVPERPLDIELKQAEVKNVFSILAEVSGRKIVLDPCVHGTVDIRLKNAPLPIVYDALAMKLGLVYEDDKVAPGTTTVRCAVAADAASAGAPSSKAVGRVSLTEKDTSLPDALAHLAVSAKLRGVDYRATSRPKVTITLEGVRLATAVAALADATSLNIAVDRDQLVVTD